MAEANDRVFGLIQQKRWTEAVGAAKQAVSLDPTSSAAWFNLGRAYLGGGKTADAVQALEQASQLTAASNADVEYFLGKALEASGQTAKAAEVYRTALQKMPGDTEIQAALDTRGSGDLIHAREALRGYLSNRSEENRNATLAVVKAFLESPSSQTLAEEGIGSGLTASSAEMPRVIYLRQGDLILDWIQWSDSNGLHIQDLYRYPLVASGAQVVPAENRQLLLVRAEEAKTPWVESVKLYELDPAVQEWKLVSNVFVALPTHVGHAKFIQDPTYLSVYTNSKGSADTGRITFVNPTSFKICDTHPETACLTATWDGRQFRPQ